MKTCYLHHQFQTNSRVYPHLVRDKFGSCRKWALDTYISTDSQVSLTFCISCPSVWRNCVMICISISPIRGKFPPVPIARWLGRVREREEGADPAYLLPQPLSLKCCIFSTFSWWLEASSLFGGSSELHCDHSLFYCKFYLSRFTQVIGDGLGQISFVYNNCVSLCMYCAFPSQPMQRSGAETAPTPVLLTHQCLPSPTISAANGSAWLKHRLTQTMTMLYSSSLPD